MERRVDDGLEERDHAEDEQRVDYLHLVRLEGEAVAEFAVHARRLERPARTLVKSKQKKKNQKVGENLEISRTKNFRIIIQMIQKSMISPIDNEVS